MEKKLLPNLDLSSNDEWKFSFSCFIPGWQASQCFDGERTFRHLMSGSIPFFMLLRFSKGHISCVSCATLHFAGYTRKPVFIGFVAQFLLVLGASFNLFEFGWCTKLLRKCIKSINECEYVNVQGYEFC